jgi:hypothetical protein
MLSIRDEIGKSDMAVGVRMGLFFPVRFATVDWGGVWVERWIGVPLPGDGIP